MWLMKMIEHSRLWILTSAVLITFSAIGAVPVLEIEKPNKSPKHNITLTELPSQSIEVHSVNNLHLSVTNTGNIGIGFEGSEIDPETGEPAPSCEFPANSDITYLWRAAFWAGGVLGTDTLVSVGFDGNRYVQELWPQPGPAGAIIRRSSLKTSNDYSVDAVSEQDFISTYYDTFIDPGLTGTDPIDNRNHIPLGLEINQRSYAWSYDYAQDFIMFDFTIKNINTFPLRTIYFGLYVDADVYHTGNTGGGWQDDICGYLKTYPSNVSPCLDDEIQMAYTMDNDGDPVLENGYVWGYTSARGATGAAILRTPNPELQYSFNWWVANSSSELDWGPRMASTEEWPYRDFGTGMGSPNGDRNKYYMMSKPEFDYDQLESAISHADEGFLPPMTQHMENFADGFDARYLFSFGPFDLNVGDTLPITLAYVGGENVHRNADDFIRLWQPRSPSLYINSLDFSNLAENARWAHFIFDNPGVDTDGNGDSGRYIYEVEVGDEIMCFREDNTPEVSGEDYPLLPDSLREKAKQIFYKGDGVPDFRGAAPPPAPHLRVYPQMNSLRIRWNGEESETTNDFFSGIKDFEGYRVYFGNDNRATDYILVSEYDIDNFNVYSWNSSTQLWELGEAPITRDSLQIIFDDLTLDPDEYLSPQTAYRHESGIFYFVPQGWNSSDLTDKNGIYKVYPEANKNDSSDTTDEGFHRYYEYEYILKDLMPSVPYYVSVTAFDFGSRRFDLSALESAFSNNEILAYATPVADQVEKDALPVMVYPNPYRVSDGYAAQGYENRDRTRAVERARAIHFANLPKVCTIRIYSVDGDLVREIDHNRPDGGPDAQHEIWDLISRNTQAVVTGIYIYHISSDMGEQIGKLVIIK